MVLEGLNMSALMKIGSEDVASNSICSDSGSESGLLPRPPSSNTTTESVEESSQKKKEERQKGGLKKHTSQSQSKKQTEILTWHKQAVSVSSTGRTPPSA